MELLCSPLSTIVSSLKRTLRLAAESSAGSFADFLQVLSAQLSDSIWATDSPWRGPYLRVVVRMPGQAGLVLGRVRDSLLLLQSRRSMFIMPGYAPPNGNARGSRSMSLEDLSTDLNIFLHLPRRELSLHSRHFSTFVVPCYFRVCR